MRVTCWVGWSARGCGTQGGGETDHGMALGRLPHATPCPCHGQQAKWGQGHPRPRDMCLPSAARARGAGAPLQHGRRVASRSNFNGAQGAWLGGASGAGEGTCREAHRDEAQQAGRRDVHKSSDTGLPAWARDLPIADLAAGWEEERCTIC